MKLKDALQLFKLKTANLQIPTGAGASKVLTSDASGNATWETASGGGFTSQVSVQAGNSQSIGAGATVKIAFDDELLDTSSEYDTTNYRFTATNTGWYLVNARVGWSGQTDQVQCVLYIYKNNGSAYRSIWNMSSTGGETMSITQVMALNATDFIDIRVNNGDSGSQTINPTGSGTNFSVIRVA